MSAPPNSVSRFRQAVEDDECKEVAMNDYEWVKFSETPCIGTDGLGACSVVLIVSRLAAIMGHISPRPANPILTMQMLETSMLHPLWTIS
jgi:hypothetical protein